MEVLITGANGTVGSVLRSRLREEFTLTGIDIDNKGDMSFGDIRDYGSIRPFFEKKDAVVHLAVHPISDDNWSDILDTNIIGTYNVLEAARDANVPRFVFASSNHVVGLYEHENVPEIYYGEVDFRLDETTAPRPDSYYGASKAFGESLTCFYTNCFQYPRQSQSLRIGSVRDPEYDHPFGDAERGVETGDWERGSAPYELQVARQKAMWLSRRDCAQLFRRCLEADTAGHDIFYGVSDNERRWFDLQHARSELGYIPDDSSDDWDSPPNDLKNGN